MKIFDTKHSALRSASLIAMTAVLLSACASSNKETPTTTANTSHKSSIGQKFDKAFEQSLNEARNTQDINDAEKIYAELIALRPNDPVIATEYAKTLRNDNQLSKAKTVLSKFTNGENADPEALTELAMVHLAMGEFKEAELRARETITKLPENGRAFLALGTALDAQKYYEQAETAFRRGIEYWNGDPAPILNNLALNLASQGKLDEAISVLERARETSPDRIEIERNYRILSTLRESSELNAPKPGAKPTVQIKPKPEKKADQKPVASGKPIRPQPVLENDPALKDHKKTETKKKETPVIEAEETKSEPLDNGPIPSNPRSIQTWRR